jgi:hypothetical protein
VAKNPTISFGDNVRVRSTPETRERGIAGLRGQVYGETTPSTTGVQVMGTTDSDFAVNVRFLEQNKDYWFALDLLEFENHAPGTEIRIGNVAWTWVRSASGEWVKQSVDTRKSWWKIWGRDR